MNTCLNIPLINTPLQRRGSKRRETRNRLTGFLNGREVDKPVKRFADSYLVSLTPLKRGVNESDKHSGVMGPLL